ncbi:hypothetical protein BSU04_17100 [Caballeronia sordidicola]|uniref:Uncharacterized protein n=1 Tax=Caballeronia sordidicola TaxID=196367 RepID=A0A226X2P6_CABSO|nr:hypothetical protein BSU04_17100 [Caballeronia sordidicola]
MEPRKRAASAEPSNLINWFSFALGVWGLGLLVWVWLGRRG